jgi:type IV pilus assembly protein PilM
MAKVIWGLDLGDWALKVARATYDKKADSITVDVMDTIAYGDLPCGHDASPIEKHREGIVAFRSRYEIGPRDDLCVCVSGGEVFSRFINLPPVLERMDEIIGYEARQQIPFDIDDVVWDWQAVKEEDQIEVGEEVEVGLFALKKERVAELMSLLEPWQDNLRIVQNAPLAVYNLLQYEGLADEPSVVLDVGSATTDVLVLNPPRYWVRTLLVAGGDLTNALTEQFGIGRGEAETVKRRVARSTHKEQVLRILQPVFEDLANEVQRSLGYYKSLSREVKFDRILALGGTMELAGLSEMLASSLQYEVKTVRELSRLRFAGSLDPEKTRAALSSFCAALGLLVQGAGEARIRINMVPEELAMASAVGAKKPWLLAAAVALLVVAVVLSLGERVYAQDVKLIAENTNFGKLDEADKLGAEYASKSGAARAVETELRSLVKADIPRDLYLDLLPDFAEELPDGVYLVDLRFEWIEPTTLAQGLQTIADWGAVAPKRTLVATRQTAAARVAAPAVSAANEDADLAQREAMAAQERQMVAQIIQQQQEEARQARIESMGQGEPRRRTPEGETAGGPRPAAQARTITAGRSFTGPVSPLATDKSRLVVRFVCESKTTNKDFIDQQVIEKLRKAQFAGQVKLAFTEVKRLGDLIDIYRDTKTLERVADPGPGVERFAGFEGYAVVNVGPAGEAGQAGAAEAAGGRRRR